MQEIKIYVSAENSIAVVRDYANSRGQSAPSLVRDVDVLLKFRLFAANGSMDPYPIEQLKSVSVWRFVMDRDFDSGTANVIVADNERITVELVSEIIDGVEYQYSQIAVPVSNTNTKELSEWLGNNKQQNGLTAELAGYDSNGNTVFVLQIENFSVRNRLTDMSEPIELPSGYWTEAQVRAFAASEIERTVAGAVTRIVPQISDSNTWVVDGADTNVPVNGEPAPEVKIQYSADGYIWGTVPDGADYIRFSTDGGESWSDPAHIRGRQGEQGIQGPQGIQGEKGERGAAFKIDASGSLTDRSQYDGEAKDFSFLATDNGNVYIKQSDTSGDWSDPIPFKGDKGDKPFNLCGDWSAGSVYRKDDAVNYNGSLYVAITQTSAEPGTDGTWSLYVSKGDKGEKGENGVLEANYIDITAVTDGFLIVSDETIPVSVEINNAVYPVLGMQKENGTFKIPVSPILAAANLAAYSGTWRVWRAGGKQGSDGIPGGAFPIALVDVLPENPDPATLYLIPVE